MSGGGSGGGASSSSSSASLAKQKIDSIRITGSEVKSSPDSHIAYAIEVSTKKRAWTITRRYNDFVAFQDALKESFDYRGTLPPKRTFGNMSPAFVESRRAGLEQYLKTLIMTASDKVLQSTPVDKFLEIKAQLSKASPEDDSGSDWLDLFREVEELGADVSAQLAQRDKVLQEGGDGDRVSLDARKKLVLFTKQAALLAEQLKKLEADPSLADLSDKEIIRRQDLMAKLRAQKEKLENWMRTPKMNSAAEERSGLMAGGAGYDQNGYSTQQAAPARRGPRVFGQETEKTRGVDDQGLVQFAGRRWDASFAPQMQKQALVEQEATLDVLLNTLSKTKFIADSIGQELDEQQLLLEKIDGQVDKASADMKSSMKKMKKIS